MGADVPIVVPIVAINTHREAVIDSSYLAIPRLIAAVATHAYESADLLLLQ